METPRMIRLMRRIHQTRLWKAMRDYCPDAAWEWARRRAYGFAAYRRTRNFIARSEQRYRNDARFDLGNVTRGFAPRLAGAHDDDRDLMERICAAYERASRAQAGAGTVYAPALWWQRMQERGLTNVRRALTDHDLSSLRVMYQNFFRDPCSTGLIEQSYSRIAAHSDQPIPALRQRFLIADALERLDYWRKLTGNRFALSDLAGPETGNPFGVEIDGVLVRTGAEYQHYCAQRVAGLMDTPDGSVAEIGGGYGGMAYYLLRDFPKMKYIGFDVPESLALTTYYLSKALPQRRLLLYGEGDPIAEYDVILLPACMLRHTSSQSVDIVFTSQTMALLAPEARAEYLRDIARISRKHFLCIGHGDQIHSSMRSEDGSLAVLETKASAWNDHSAIYPDEFECLYGVEATQQQTKHCIH
jgi:hypothetical protein